MVSPQTEIFTLSKGQSGSAEVAHFHEQSCFAKDIMKSWYRSINQGSDMRVVNRNMYKNITTKKDAAATQYQSP